MYSLCSGRRLQTRQKYYIVFGLNWAIDQVWVLLSWALHQIVLYLAPPPAKFILLNFPYYAKNNYASIIYTGLVVDENRWADQLSKSINNIMLSW